MLNALRHLWCRLWHRSVQYAGGRYYRCRRCNQYFDVPWRNRDR